MLFFPFFPSSETLLIINCLLLSWNELLEHMCYVVVSLNIFMDQQNDTINLTFCILVLVNLLQEVLFATILLALNNLDAKMLIRSKFTMDSRFILPFATIQEFLFIFNLIFI